MGLGLAHQLAPRLAQSLPLSPGRAWVATCNHTYTPSEDWLQGCEFRADTDEKAFLADHVNCHEPDRLDVSKLHQYVIAAHTRVAGHRFTEKLQHSLWSTLSCCKHMCCPEPRPPGHCGLSSGRFRRIVFLNQLGIQEWAVF